MDARSTRLVSAFQRLMSIWHSNKPRSGKNNILSLSFITTENNTKYAIQVFAQRGVLVYTTDLLFFLNDLNSENQYYN